MMNYGINCEVNYIKSSFVPRGVTLHVVILWLHGMERRTFVQFELNQRQKYNGSTTHGKLQHELTFITT